MRINNTWIYSICLMFVVSFGFVSCDKKSSSNEEEKTEKESKSDKKEKKKDKEKTAMSKADARKELKAQIYDISKELPIEIDDNIALYSIDIEGNNLVVLYVINEDNIDLASLYDSLDQNSIDSMAEELFSNPDDLALLKASGYAVVLRYMGYQSEDSFDVTADPNDF